MIALAWYFAITIPIAVVIVVWAITGWVTSTPEEREQWHGGWDD